MKAFLVRHVFNDKTWEDVILCAKNTFDFLRRFRQVIQDVPDDADVDGIFYMPLGTYDEDKFSYLFGNKNGLTEAIELRRKLAASATINNEESEETEE